MLTFLQLAEQISRLPPEQQRKIAMIQDDEGRLYPLQRIAFATKEDVWRRSNDVEEGDPYLS